MLLQKLQNEVPRIKKINPVLDKWANKAEASRFALKACNIK